MNTKEDLNLTLEEKIALCSGADFWHTKEIPGAPAMMMCDGPHGLRKREDAADMLGVNHAVPATCFPTAVSTSCSWDEELLGEIGEAIASEAAANGVGLLLGPGANIKRDPLCGRNFEYFSEDPYLTGKKRAEFYEQHTSEIISCQAAKRYFDSLGLKKLPSMQSLKQEYAILQAENKKLYPEYKQAKAKMLELLTAKSNVERILGMTDRKKNRDRQQEARQ